MKNFSSKDYLLSLKNILMQIKHFLPRLKIISKDDLQPIVWWLHQEHSLTHYIEKQTKNK